jgi:hypothetical protein
MAAKKFSDEEVKHLEFIQGVITRMNSNSFQMKGWMVAIVSALLAIYADKQNPTYALVAILPTLIFWGLDTYYLWQERKFRGLYNDVAGITENPKEIKLFAMRPDLYTGDKYSFWDVFGSITIVPLYLPVILILLAIYFVL